jgi:hypothetical protein
LDILVNKENNMKRERFFGVQNPIEGERTFRAWTELTEEATGMKLGGPYCENHLPPGKQAYQVGVFYCIRCEKDLEEKMRTK